jgi:hypothetical protein
MKEQFKKLEAFPKIVRAGKATEITFTMSDGSLSPFRASENYHVTSISLQQSAGFHEASAVTLTSDGALKATCLFSGEQEHILYVHTGDPDPRNALAEAHIYSLEEDLVALTPYKGDMHMHSTRSDGEEPPAHVAAACRRIGLDYMALTDHGQYAPSGEAQEAFAGVDADLKIYRGEEVHVPGNSLHIINFGGSRSVNDLSDDDRYPQWVRETAERVGELPENVDPHQYAASVWAFEQIRAAGGLGIYCHPYWVSTHRESRQGYYVNEALITHLFDTQPYDAYEVIGGYHLFEADSNTLQVARYHDERAKGRNIPIVGVSDAHGCENGKLFGWYYTIVFSPSVELPDLISSIKGLNSVAVEALPEQVARAYGPFRLVKYALFLMHHVFPGHDALCAEEGQWMLRHIAGDEQAVQALHGCRGRVQKRMDKEFGRG